MKTTNFILIIASFFSLQVAKAEPLSQFSLGLEFNEQVIPPNDWSELENRYIYSHIEGHVLKYSFVVLEEKQAKKVLKNKLAQLRMLYAPQTAAYPGMLTKGQDCMTKARLATKIQQKDQSPFWLSEMPATDDGQIGTCGLKPENRWAQMLVIYCKKSKKLFDLQFTQSAKLGSKPISVPIAKCPKT